ncbi:hypothetical protein [Bacillus cereus]|uniref:hypothetical protein n=1 Tax=Bacillus cereus TaxID=1396 RepID=UPI00397F6F3F
MQLFELTDEQWGWFIQIHKRHMKAFGTENQKKYALENIINIQYDKEKDTLIVYYDDIWWHYNRHGDWY